MSLSTLLEAAKFLEQQDQERQHRATVEAALAISRPLTTTLAPSIITHNHKSSNNIHLNGINQNGQPQTVVISSSSIIQGPITLSAPITIKKEQDHQISSTVTKHSANTPANRARIFHNSFDIMNSLVIDDTTNSVKRKPPPMAFRAGNNAQHKVKAWEQEPGTREVHNKLEKCRRAHLKECFEMLKKQLPQQPDEKKTSNLSILHHASRYIQVLKRKERELEHEMERLARDKISSQQKLAVLKKDLSHFDNIDFSKILPDFGLNGSSVENNTVSINEPVTTTSIINGNGVVTSSENGTSVPIISKNSIAPVQSSIKEVSSSSQTVQATQLSVLPVNYPMNQGLVLQKVALVPKGLTDITPLMSTHFTLTNQQLNGKVVPLTQYIVKPVVVVSSASARPSNC